MPGDSSRYGVTSILASSSVSGLLGRKRLTTRVLLFMNPFSDAMSVGGHPNKYAYFTTDEGSIFRCKSTRVLEALMFMHRVSNLELVLVQKLRIVKMRLTTLESPMHRLDRLYRSSK